MSKLRENLCKRRFAENFVYVSSFLFELAFFKVGCRSSDLSEQKGYLRIIYRTEIHRLNMVGRSPKLFGLHVHSCTRWLRPCNPPPPRNWAHSRGCYWVSLDRRHLFVTPCCQCKLLRTKEKIFIHFLIFFVGYPDIGWVDIA